MNRCASTENVQTFKKLKVAVDLDQVRNDKRYAGKVYQKTIQDELINGAKQKKIDHLSSTIFTTVETKTVKKDRRHLEENKFGERQKKIVQKDRRHLEENDETRRIFGRNNSYIGKRQYDVMHTKENIFPNSNLATIDR